MADLKPAETNPWYVLSTLHGPQTGERIDWDLARKNVALWNVWSCQKLTDEQREKLSAGGAKLPDVDAWKQQKEEIETLYKKRFSEMGIGEDEMPEIPDAESQIDMSTIAFSHIVVWEKAIFGQDADFMSATFAQDAYFMSATFAQSADFDSATFTQSASFNSATFAEFADFSSATFAQFAYFTSATFAQSADFMSATFSGFAYFRKVQFGTDTPPDFGYSARFSDAIFERPTSFRDACFKYRYPILDGTVFHDKTQFTAERAFWPQGNQPNPKQAKESCATLRHVMAKQGLPEDEYFFFRKEMEFSGKIGGFWRTRPVKAYGVFSDYGASIAKPLAGLGALWLGCALIYMVAFNWPGVVDPEFVPAGKGFGFSIANMVKFLGFQRTYYAGVIQNIPNWMQFLAAVQTTFAYVLVFFLGLGLRSRFRLR